MASSGQTSLTLYPLSNFKIGSKEQHPTKAETVEARTARLKAQYQAEGVRRTALGLMLVNQHRHPHLLILKQGDGSFRLPGGRLRPGEDEVQGLKRKLAGNLAPTSPSLVTDWDVGECVATFWRPSHNPSLYPYLPAHITKPKEIIKAYVIPLPERCYFAVPRNWQLIAVPLFELYRNVDKFGPVIAGLPEGLSRFRVTLVGEEPPPAAAPSPGADAEVVA